MLDNKEQIAKLEQIFDTMLSRLSEREREVVKRRYQLTNDLADTATLKEIGDSYNITRERVRQIEREAINKLNNLSDAAEFNTILKSYEDQLIAFLKERGGLMREDSLLQEFVSSNYDTNAFHPNAYLFIFDNLFDGVSNVADHEHFYNVWKVKDFNLDKIAGWFNSVENKVIEKGDLHEDKEIVSLAKELLADEVKADLEKLVSGMNDAKLEGYIGNYLNAYNKLEKNILGQWGQADWQTVSPKKLGDKIFLIFQKETKPLHFRDIAERINEAKFNSKKVCAATVHNELIANGNYVLIGRGIYALKNWGYETGTVADIIEKVLTEAGQPMHKNDIYEKVLQQRKVNKSTIYLTLINKDKFTKLPSGEFGIK